MPKFLLITASSPEIKRARKSRVLNFQQITMPYLAARVPRDWHVIHIDEEAEEYASFRGKVIIFWDENMPGIWSTRRNCFAP